ncbi:MAG: hypothetical protein JWP03_4152 [Phycisphaerales bacterium]|jgi:hypothetical protein|nr:hypothetical protein [Phycisphaerales bacterium]HWE96174.1 hypothetical protein [Tepidisphaeraceae bacterium]
MQDSQLIPWIVAVPFEPFAAYLSDGRRIEVTHPEMVALATYAIALYVFHAGGQVEVIDAAHISSLRSLGQMDPTPYL